MPEGQKPVSRIAVLREQKGLTQLELSLLLGVTETTIQNWEKGRAGLEQIERVINLCKVLECKPEELIKYVPVSDGEAASPKSQGRLQRMRQLLGTDQSIDTDKANQSASCDETISNHPVR